MPTGSLNHPWDVTPAEAREIQRELAARVRVEDCIDLARVNRVAGVDVGFESQGRVTRAAVAVLDYPGLELLEHRIARVPTRFPYIPGLLSFRELPAVLVALEALVTPPDLLLCDGQGLAHPRRLGIASHLGVLTGLPTIGVAKSRLLGHYREPEDRRGATTPLMEGDERIGTVVRSRVGVKPIFVSPGHCVSHASAVAMVMACTTRYRLPETTRWAHRLASDPRYRDG